MQRIVPILIDLVAVGLFALIGRISHARSLSLGGWFETAWPFGLACLIGWVVVALIAADPFGLKAGTVLWLVTWLAGLAIRILAGGTAAVAFVLVAGGVTALFLLGWRLAATDIRRRRSA